MIHRGYDPSDMELVSTEIMLQMSYMINYIKTQRLAWFGHVHRMPDNSMVKKVYEWSPALTRSLGRPKNRWGDDVKSDITRMKITNWKDCNRNRTKWKKLVEKPKTSLKFVAPQEEEEEDVPTVQTIG